jgi:cytochrome c553
MSDRVSPGDALPRRATLAAVLVFLLSAVGGLVLLPELQPSFGAAGLWDAICSAAGLFRPRSGAAPAPPTPGFTPTDVLLRSDFLRAPDAAAIGRGATLAQRCAICHGPTGVSRADSPNLAGQYPSAIYKELIDFHTGARVNATMSPFAANLSDQDMRDLAAYYAYLPQLPATAGQAVPTPAIVSDGAPLRNIPPCGACHGTLEAKTASPWLGGQPASYIKAQLTAFASGARRNDLDAQMRNIARNMTSKEIDEAAKYYGSRGEPAP